MPPSKLQSTAALLCSNQPHDLPSQTWFPVRDSNNTHALANASAPENSSATIITVNVPTIALVVDVEQIPVQRHEIGSSCDGMRMEESKSFSIYLRALSPTHVADFATSLAACRAILAMRVSNASVEETMPNLMKSLC